MVVPIAVACGSETGTEGVDLTGKPFQNLRDEADVTIDSADNRFTPQYVTVSVGTTVTFDNVGRNPHNVISIGDTFSSVDTADFNPDATAAITFETVGDFPYYCTLHGTPTKGMTGAVRVVK